MKKWVLIFILALIVISGVLLSGVLLADGEENFRAERQLVTEAVGPTVYDIKVEQYNRFDDTAVEKMSFIHRVDILSVGDIMAHTNQFEAAKVADGYDFYPQFEEISTKITSKDFSIANLETVFAGEDKRYSGKNMIFNAPDNLGLSIKKAGFDIITTANNHSLDRGYYGIKRTIETLDQLELLHTGTYIDDNREILTFEKDGFSFALLSYSFSTNGWPMPEGYPESLNMMEQNLIINDIKEAKALGVDFVMVANHWGLEYHSNENHHQRNLADALFYAGADIILGTHPHVLQPFVHKTMKDVSGQNKDKFIIYSQGNFLSGQRSYPRAIGMYINFEFERNGSDKYVSEVSVMPTYVEDGYKNNQRYMRILDVHQSQRDYEAGLLDISKGLYNDLKSHEETFIAHLSSRVKMTPYLNDELEYVIYETK